MLGGALPPICARWRGSARAACARLTRAAQLTDLTRRLDEAAPVDCGLAASEVVDCGPNAHPWLSENSSSLRLPPPWRLSDSRCC